MAVLSGCARFFPGEQVEISPEPDARAEAITSPTTTEASPARSDVEVETEPPRDLWREIATELRMAPADAGEPLTHFGNSREFVRNAAERARPFLFHIHEAIKQRGLPMEIILLPIIESSYDPQATSPHGAAGLWQFMPATARHYGLRVTRWYDGRRDVVESTRAALDYLEHLRDRFIGDWRLALAAYNCGERTVERAIERNQRLGRPQHFHALELPRQTREYVPRLMALVEIIAHPEAHGIELPTIPAEPYFDSVEAGTGLDLERIVDQAALPAAEFALLNAAHRKRFTVEGAPNRIHVPRALVPGVEQVLATLPAEARGKPRVHVVKSGETLSHIADATGVPVTALRAANGLNSSRLAIGQEILVPQPHAALALTGARPVARATVHIVRQGDNLWDLARRYHTSVSELTHLNGLSRRTVLRLGQKLRIPARSGATAPAEPTSSKADQGAAYRVRRGDSLWTIARRFKVSVAELRSWNALDRGHVLQPGQILVVERPAVIAQDI